MEYITRIQSESTKLVSAPDAKILVVDDSRVNLHTVTGMLKLFGIRCDTALSGIIAVDLIRRKHYDIVFMDYMMPDMDGIEATKCIRELGPDKNCLPIIAFTSETSPNVKELLIECGMNDYIYKPVEKLLLNEMLKKWLPASKIHNVEQHG